MSNLTETLSAVDFETKAGQILKRYEPNAGDLWRVKRDEVKNDALALAALHLEHWRGFLPASDEIGLRDIEIVIYDWEKATTLANFGEWHWMRLVLVREATFELESAVANNNPEKIKKWTGMLTLAGMLPGGVIDDRARPRPVS